MGDSSRSSIDLHTNSAKRHVRSHGADERRRQDERHAREVRHGHVRCLEGGRGPTSLGRPCEERGYSRGSHGRVLALPLQRLQRDVHHLQSLARWGRGNLRLEHHSSASWEARVPSPRAQAGGHRQGLCLHLRQRQDLHQQGYWGLLQDRQGPRASFVPQGRRRPLRHGEGQLHVHPPHSCLHCHCWCFCRPKNLHPLQGGYCYVRRHRKVQGGRGRGPSQGGPERKDLVEDQAACEEDRVDQWKTGLGGKNHQGKEGWVGGAKQQQSAPPPPHEKKKEKERKSSSKCYQGLYNVIFVSIFK